MIWLIAGSALLSSCKRNNKDSVSGYNKKIDKVDLSTVLEKTNCCPENSNP